MWARLDDALIDHRKVFAAGRLIGKNGAGVAIGFFAVGLMWSNKHLSDGFLPEDVVTNFPHFENPRSVADALATAGLFERVEGGYHIHDFHDHNPSAAAVKKKRADDAARKRSNGRGHG